MADDFHDEELLVVGRRASWLCMDRHIQAGSHYVAQVKAHALQYVLPEGT